MKGRRLVANDLANDNRVAALLSWHFEPDETGRPHLVTSAAIRSDVVRAVEAEYLVALWFLVCVAAAIDRRTLKYGKVGVVRDRGIEPTVDQLVAMGFRPGPRRDGYKGDYFTLDT